MNQEDQLLQRLHRFYQDAKSEISATPPRWEAPGQRRGRWIQPVFASAALAVIVLSVVVGVRMLRENRNQVQVTTSPTASASASATPSATATPTPAPSPGPNWVTQRYPVGTVVAMALDAYAAYALAPPKLARIGRTNGAVAIGATAPNASGIAQTGSGVWVAAGPGIAPAPSNQQSLTLFDAASLQIKRQLALPGQPGGETNVGPQLAGHASLLWLGYGNRIYRLNADTGTTLLSQSIPGTAVSISLDSSGQRLYVGVEVSANATGQDRLIELDASTGAILSSSETGGRSLGGPHVSAAGDGVWVTYATGMRGAVEHRAASNLATIPITEQPDASGNPPGFSNAVGVAVGANAVWLVDVELRCADPRTGTVRASTHEDSAGPFVVDAGGAYLGDSTGVAAMQPPAACRG